MAMETWFFPKETNEKKEAILITMDGRGVRQHEAWIFEHKEDKIVWTDHAEKRPGTSRGFITAFEEVH